MSGITVKKNYHTYPRMGYCIYCGTTKGALSKEHIVPYALNGNWVLPEASCEKCSAITKKYEADFSTAWFQRAFMYIVS